MRVGAMLGATAALSSLQTIARSLYQALSARHELVFLDPAYNYVPDAEQKRMLEEFFRRSDVVVGIPGPGMGAARRAAGRNVPFVRFLYGEMGFGAWGLIDCRGVMDTNDVFVANCASDVDIANAFFTNLPTRVVPFAFDAADFHPISTQERRAAREALGIGEHDPVVLYAGRINPEKNVREVLRIFRVVSRRLPDAHLVLAGAVDGGGPLAGMFNVAPALFPNTFKALISRLGLPGERVHLVGKAGPGRLRELYNLADVKVNLTLNPDENFGLGQVEAMACGTPVVGTRWGGLKDTVVEGVTGHGVSTVATGTGVKVDWWEAANRTIALLEDRPARERFRESLPRHAGRYSQEAFAAAVEEIVCAAVENRDRPAEPLRSTPFADEFWSVCNPGSDVAAPFRRGPRSEELYRALVTPSCGVTASHVAAGDPLEPGQVLSLATPVETDGAGGLRPDHAFYPFRVEVPEAHRPAVHAILAVMRDEPALTAERLTGARLEGVPGVPDALRWMFDAGLVLRTRHVPGWIDPADVDGRLGEVLFSVQPIDRAATDLIVYR